MLEIFTFVIAIILLILQIIDWYVFIKLWRILHHNGSIHNTALRERTTVAGILSLATTLSAFLAIIRLFDLHPGSGVTLLILSGILLLIGIPNIYWLILYSRNQLRK